MGSFFSHFKLPEGILKLGTSGNICKWDFTSATSGKMWCKARPHTPASGINPACDGTTNDSFVALEVQPILCRAGFVRYQITTRLPLQSSATNIPDYRLQWLWLVTFKCGGDLSSSHFLGIPAFPRSLPCPSHHRFKNSWHMLPPKLSNYPKFISPRYLRDIREISPCPHEKPPSTGAMAGLGGQQGS